MADKSIQHYDAATGSAVQLKAKDNGDGSHSWYMENPALGAPADTLATADSGAWSIVALLKRLATKFTTQFPAALGQGTMAQSLTVTVASNQTAVPVSGPVTDAQLRASAVPVSTASLPLPNGAATETTLAALSAKYPTTLGQKTGANSLAVVVASDQNALTTSNQNNAVFASVANYSVTTTAGAVGGNVACRSVIVKAAPANTVPVLVGDSTAQAYPLAAGEFIVIPTTNVNTVYAKTASGTATLHVMKA